MFRLAYPSLQNSGHPKSYDHLYLTRKYAFASIMKLLTIGTSGCKSSEEAVAKIVCSLDSCKCIDRVCDSCGVTELTDHLFEDLTKMTQYFTVSGKTWKEM